MSPDTPPVALLDRLSGLLPAAGLAPLSPPLVKELRLWLLSDLLPGMPLDAQVASALMEEPPYWSFCWASGQVLARYLLDHPDQVAGRTVVDVGSGSGVVAIAAARAGAARVIACDLDPDARLATGANASLNQVHVEVAGRLEDCMAEADLLTAADILYDRDNLGWLARMRLAGSVLLADSRVPDLTAPGYRFLTEQHATTWPDLDESAEFNRVRLFLAD